MSDDPLDSPRLVHGVDYIYAFYHGEEVSSPEGMIIAIEKSPSEVRRVAFERVLRFAKGGQVTFKIADGTGQSGEAVRQEKAIVDEAFRMVAAASNRTFVDLGAKK